MRGKVARSQLSARCAASSWRARGLHCTRLGGNTSASSAACNWSGPQLHWGRPEAAGDKSRQHAQQWLSVFITGHRSACGLVLPLMAATAPHTSHAACRACPRPATASLQAAAAFKTRIKSGLVGQAHGDACSLPWRLSSRACSYTRRACANEQHVRPSLLTVAHCLQRAQLLLARNIGQHDKANAAMVDQKRHRCGSITGLQRQDTEGLHEQPGGRKMVGTMERRLTKNNSTQECKTTEG